MQVRLPACHLIEEEKIKKLHKEGLCTLHLGCRSCTLISSSSWTILPYLPISLPYPIPYHLSRYTYVLLEKKLSLPASIHPNTPLQSSNHPTSHPTSHVMSCHVMPCHVKPALVPPYSVASTYLPTFLPYPHTYQGT